MAITYLSGERIQGSSDESSFTPASSFNVEYLVVAGGGSGATADNTSNSEGAGGGGAGGYRTATGFGVTAQKYTITVGAGGAKQTSGETQGNSGSNSIFSSITSTGGGSGGKGGGSTGTAGGNGGSGGGGGADDSSAGAGGSASPSGQGNDGGAGGDVARGGGGGGSASAGAVGITGGINYGGVGGNATQNDITGTNLYYAGGGGGGAYSKGGVAGTGNVGGLGGGGRIGSDASPNTGSGGGGAGREDTPSGAGADGIVILRFTTSGNSYSQSGGAVTIDGSNTVISFTRSSKDEKTIVSNVPVGTRYEQINDRKIFRRKLAVAGTFTSKEENDAFDASNGEIMGQCIQAGHVLIGKTITSVLFKTAAYSSSASGNYKMCLFNSRGVVKHQFKTGATTTLWNGSTSTYAEVTGNDTITSGTATARTVEANDIIGIGNTAAPANRIHIRQSTSIARVNETAGKVDESRSYDGGYASDVVFEPRSENSDCYMEIVYVSDQWTEKGTA